MSSPYKYKDVPLDSFIKFTSINLDTFGGITTFNTITANQSIQNNNKSIEESYPCGYKTPSGDLVGVANYHDTGETTYETSVVKELCTVGVGGGGGGGGHGGQGNDDGPGKGPSGKSTNGGWGKRGTYGAWAFTTYSTNQNYKYIRVNHTLGTGGNTGGTGGKRNSSSSGYRTGISGGTGNAGNESYVDVRYSQNDNDYTGYTRVFTSPGGAGGNGGPGGGNKINYGPLGDTTVIASSSYTTIPRGPSALYGINSNATNVVIDGTHRGTGSFQGSESYGGLCRTYIFKT